MKNEIKDKEYYKKAMVDMINNIERQDLLVYLYRLIGNIIKAGH